MLKRSAIALSIAAALAATTQAAAQPVTITFENTQASGGFFFTPVWVGLHDGSFDSYDGGTLASNWPGLTELAELGQTGPISAAFADATGGAGVDGAITGSSGHPTLAPGESGSLTLDPADATTNRYFSYASMLIPSNDIFVANGNPFEHEVFDASGNFTGPFTIEIYGSSFNDNGTEVNDAFGGAAFSANGGTSASENNVIRNFLDNANLNADTQYLASFVGSQTATGETITHVFGPDKLVARITVVPAPGAAGLLAVAGLGGVRRRRAG